MIRSPIPFLVSSPAAFARFGPKFVQIEPHQPNDAAGLHYPLTQARQAQNDALEAYLRLGDSVKRTDLSRLNSEGKFDVLRRLGATALAELTTVAEGLRVAAVREAVRRRQQQILAVTEDPGEPTSRQLQIAEAIAAKDRAKRAQAIDQAMAEGDAETVIAIVRAPSFLGFDQVTKAKLRIEFGRRRLPDVANQLDALAAAESLLWSAIKSAEQAIRATGLLSKDQREILVGMASNPASFLDQVKKQHQAAFERKFGESIRPAERRGAFDVLNGDGAA